MSTHTTSTAHAAEEPGKSGSTHSESPYSRSRKSARRGWMTAAALTVVIGALAGCGGSAAPTPAASTIVVTATVEAPAQTVTETVPAAVPETTAAVVKSQAKPSSKVTVPDGVGMNYQDAQDAWRAAGLHVAPANDATGANRIPVLDANWVVLSQDLEAGSKVAADSFISATIKKYTDN